MTAMAALEAARALWVAQNDQLSIDFEDPAVPYGTSCRSDGAYPERNGRIPQRLAGRTEGTPPSVPFPTGADGTSEERRPASTTSTASTRSSPQTSAGGGIGGDST
jgi:hypothetical protein